MNDYQKMVREEAQSFYEEAGPQFQEDAGEHGGRSEKPNLTLWLDRTRRLFDRLDVTCKNWGRAESTMVNQSSRNSVTFGDPKESAYFAFYKDVVAELKKLRKGAG